MIDIERFRATPLVREPFAHLVVPGFVPGAAELDRDFPSIPKAGSFPLSALTHGPAFHSLVEALSGEELRRVARLSFRGVRPARAQRRFVPGGRSRHGRFVGRAYHAEWSADGTALYFVTRDAMMVADVRGLPAPDVTVH